MPQLRIISNEGVKPAPKYGHLSEPLQPVFASMRAAMDAQNDELWKTQDLAAFKQAMLDIPVFYPQNCPQPGKDYKTVEDTVKVRDGTAIGVRFYRPFADTKDAVWVLKAHGGGWTVGSHEIEEVENRLLAAAGFVVASVDYRLAPEYKFPYAVNDCFDVLRYCIEHAQSLGIDPKRVVTAGGSAGGNLAIVLGMKARDEGLSGIIGSVANIPGTCHPELHAEIEGKYELNSLKQNGNASIVDAPRVEWFWDQYIVDPKEAEPIKYHSPLLADDLSGLPPTLIQVAGYDPLRDEGLAFAEALEAAGVKTVVKIYPGLPHGFYGLPGIKESDDYWQASVDFVKELIA